MKIHIFLQQSGLDARRKIKAYLDCGRVSVNGIIVKECWKEVDPEKDLVTVDQKAYTLPTQWQYYLFNKPAGYITTVTDPFHRNTVIDYIHTAHHLNTVLHPVGRLDFDTEGLLILTNHGAFTQKVAHPTNEIPKTYYVVLSSEITTQEKKALEDGVYLEGVKTSPANLQKFRQRNGKDGNSWLITIHEGRKRQIKRMFELFGKKVVYLRREKIGNFTLQGIEKPGDIRVIKEQEIKDFEEEFFQK